MTSRGGRPRRGRVVLGRTGIHLRPSARRLILHRSSDGRDSGQAGCRDCVRSCYASGGSASGRRFPGHCRPVLTGNSARVVASGAAGGLTSRARTWAWRRVVCSDGPRSSSFL